MSLGYKKIVVKVGSNVITQANGLPDEQRINHLVNQLAAIKKQGMEVILVSSGAVASGRSLIQIAEKQDAVTTRQLLAAIGQVKLINTYANFFAEHAIKCAQVLVTKEDFRDRAHYLNMKNCMQILLQHNVIPVVNENDVVSVTELMFTDNDELAGLIASMLNADALIILSNVNGIYNGDPKLEGSKVIEEIKGSITNLASFISTGKSQFGRGGMVTKSTMAQKVAKLGITVHIANGTTDNVLTALLDEKLVHTRFVPEKSKSGKKKWIAHSETNAKGIVQLNNLAKEKIDSVLFDLALALVRSADEILNANVKDLEKMPIEDPKYDRLKLTLDRIEGIAKDIENVAKLNSPLGDVLSAKTLENQLHIQKIRVPLGVVGVIYEARPNVTADVFSLCFKTGNVAVLKGGSDAEFSNIAITRVIHQVLKKHHINIDVLTLLPAERAATEALLNARGFVDVLIPRGSQSLINYVREHSKIPVIETGAGIVHTYFDKTGDLEKGKSIILNAKTRRVSVCNALDCVLINEDRLNDLSALLSPLAEQEVELFADERSYDILKGNYPSVLLNQASPEHFGTEFLSLKMAVKVVKDIDEALDHIANYSSKHSEAIISEDANHITQFLNQVDAAAVY
ncbi:MAG: glutamate-5-semialdehyde dehydrogenase, partial [Pedobacter sp.]